MNGHGQLVSYHGRESINRVFGVREASSDVRDVPGRLGLRLIRARSLWREGAGNSLDVKLQGIPLIGFELPVVNAETLDDESDDRGADYEDDCHQAERENVIRTV
jgi:hypothetical protein